MARVYFQRYSDRNYFDAGCELHRLLHGMYHTLNNFLKLYQLSIAETVVVAFYIYAGTIVWFSLSGLRLMCG